MKAHSAVLKLVTSAAIGLASIAVLAAPTARVDGSENRGAVIAELMQSWQQRIDSQNLPVENPKNWARRNAAKFARLTDAQLDLARRAGTIEEVELLFITAPITDGTSLEALAANLPGNITIAPSKAVAKSGVTGNLNPVTSPTSYAGLVFTAVQPCRIYDSRFSTAPPTGLPGAPWAAGSTNIVDIGPRSGGYAFEGGQAVNCAGTLVAGSQIAAAMTAVSTVNQGGAGYLVFFSSGGTNPDPYGVAQWFQPGYVQTSFVVMPTDLVSNVFSSGYIGNASSHVIVDLIGYFAQPVATPLECNEVFSTTQTVPANGQLCFNAPACAAGFSATAPVNKWISGSNNFAVIQQTIDTVGGFFTMCYRSFDSVNTSTVQAGRRCCRMPGR